MEERWLFLDRKSRKDIEGLAYNLQDKLGAYWDFSKFVSESIRRQPLPNYSLETCFQQKSKIIDAKLVIGQRFFNVPQIRFAFRQGDIWADYLKVYDLKSYKLVKAIFQKTFHVLLEDYCPQQLVNNDSH